MHTYMNGDIKIVCSEPLTTKGATATLYNVPLKVIVHLWTGSRHLH